MNITTIRGEQNYWPLYWVNPMDQDDVYNSGGFVHPIGQWITVGGPLVANVAEKVDIMTHPQRDTAQLILTVVDMKTMEVKNYVPRRDFEEISKLVERGRLDEERANQSPAEASDQEGSGEGADAVHPFGAAQTAAG